MKTLITGAFSLAVLLSCSTKDGQVNPTNYFSVNTKKPSSNISEKEYKFDFDQIQVSTGIDAEVIKSDVEKVIIFAPNNIIDDVEVENAGGKLHVRMKPGLRLNLSGNLNVRAKIYAKDFNSVKAASSGSITVSDKFIQEKMAISVSSSGSINGDFEANDFSIAASSSGDYSGKIWAINLNAEASSSGEIDLKGKAKQAVMQVSSSGEINASELVAETATLQASSSGSVDLAVSRQLMASASSSGDVTVYRKGEISVTKNESSSGSVNLR